MAPSTERGLGMIAVQDLKERIQNASAHLFASETASLQRIHQLLEHTPTHQSANEPVKPARSTVLLSRKRILAVKTRVLSKIHDFCCEHCPRGRLSSHGGYWEVPAPLLIKISLSTGKFWDWDNTQRKDPIGDIFKLWTFLKGQENFRRIVIELDHWCDDVERRKPKYDLDRGFTEEDLKQGVFVLLLDNGSKPVVRGTARCLCKLLQKNYGSSNRLPIDFQKSTLFLRVLKIWAKTKESDLFTVTEKSRSKKTEFVLAVSDKEENHGLITRLRSTCKK